MAKVHGDPQLAMLIKGVAHLLTTIPVVGRTIPPALHESRTTTELPRPNGVCRRKTESLCLQLPSPLHADLLALGEFLPGLSTGEIGVKAIESGVETLMREHILAQSALIEPFEMRR